MDTEKTQDEFRHSQSLEQQAQAAAHDRAACAAGLRRSHRATSVAENPQLVGAATPPQRWTAAPVQSPHQAFRAHTEKWIKEVVDQAFPIVKLAGWVLGAIVVVSIGLSSYDSLDSSGWITQNHDTPVWIQGDWLVGEYRDCEMRTVMQPAPSDTISKLPRLFCGQDALGYVDFQLETASTRNNGNIAVGSVTDYVFDSYFHVLPVHYYGRIDRKDKWVISWRCQRNPESLTCKALD